MFKGAKGFPEVFQGYSRVSEELHVASGNFRGVPEVFKGFRAFHERSMGFQRVSKHSVGLQERS